MTSRWSDATGDTDAVSYAARFERLAAAGHDVHGEATLCTSLVAPGARVLDAGCGTGRVAIRLAELGYNCAGVDLDESMLAHARAQAPQLPWVSADLADVDLLAAGHQPFDLVLAAGNVVPLVASGAEPQVVARLAAHLADGGLLVAGFGLDRSHLPPAAGLLTLEDYDKWCSAAGLSLVRRLATWSGEAYDGGGYAVSIHGGPSMGEQFTGAAMGRQSRSGPPDTGR
jgi:2-polyprenyl-3-methyl-5-hydroxy-6-metoxy-1,4-benzoquinol methylase